MSGEVQKAEAAVIVVVAAVGLYLGYKAYKTGSEVVKKAGEIGESITGAANKAGQVVVNAGSKAVSAVQDAYAETMTFITGQQHYSPDALQGSMSKDDAIKLAVQIEERNAILESQEYEDMVRREQYSLLRSHPADQTSDPSLPYFGYGR